MGCRSVLGFSQCMCRLFVIASWSTISTSSANKIVQHAVQCRDKICHRTILLHFEHIEYKFPETLV